MDSRHLGSIALPTAQQSEKGDRDAVPGQAGGGGSDSLIASGSAAI